MITVLDQTGSTNADIAAAIRAGESWPEGHWLIALRQTAGRGRQGRSWLDGAGNFMGSTLVEPRADDPPAASLSFVAALAVHEAVRGLLGAAAPLALKWPNDVLLGEGKLSGILLEMVAGKVVVGIGVNLAHAPAIPGRTIAAIADCTAPPSPSAFAPLLARAFAGGLAAWRAEGLGAVLDRFLACSRHALGEPLTVHDSGGAPLAGTFAGLDPSDGALRLCLADGSERVIRAGDIS